MRVGRWITSEDYFLLHYLPLLCFVLCCSLSFIPKSFIPNIFKFDGRRNKQMSLFQNAACLTLHLDCHLAQYVI